MYSDASSKLTCNFHFIWPKLKQRQKALAHTLKLIEFLHKIVVVAVVAAKSIVHRSSIVQVYDAAVAGLRPVHTKNKWDRFAASSLSFVRSNRKTIKMQSSQLWPHIFDAAVMTMRCWVVVLCCCIEDIVSLWSHRWSLLCAHKQSWVRHLKHTHTRGAERHTAHNATAVWARFFNLWLYKRTHVIVVVLLSLHVQHIKWSCSVIIMKIAFKTQFYDTNTQPCKYYTDTKSVCIFLYSIMSTYSEHNFRSHSRWLAEMTHIIMWHHRSDSRPAERQTLSTCNQPTSRNEASHVIYYCHIAITELEIELSGRLIFSSLFSFYFLTKFVMFVK